VSAPATSVSDESTRESAKRIPRSFAVFFMVFLLKYIFGKLRPVNYQILPIFHNFSKFLGISIGLTLYFQFYHKKCNKAIDISYIYMLKSYLR
jgi:hypothetical protein